MASTDGAPPALPPEAAVAAAFAERLPGGRVRCRLCPKLCVLREGEVGFCQVRQNRGGTLVALNYGRNAVMALDPVEKKPLFHFHPGSLLLSIGTVGCNLACAFCQNWHISQVIAETEPLGPEEAVAAALRARRDDPRCIGICFTYTEPVIWYEYVRDVADLARAAGLVSVLKTNGYITAEALLAWLPRIDAMNVDLKGFDPGYYRRVCRGTLAPVLETIRRAHHAGCHVELTTPLIPGENDDPAQLEAMAAWIASVDPDIPLHLTRYYPDYQMAAPPTPLAALERARCVCRRYLRYVYLGNVWGGYGTDTVCPACGALLIERAGYEVRVIGLAGGGACARCGHGTRIRGVAAACA